MTMAPHSATWLNPEDGTNGGVEAAEGQLRLRQSPDVLRCLRKLGIGRAVVKKEAMGLVAASDGGEPQGRTLIFPLSPWDGSARRRFGRLRVVGSGSDVRLAAIEQTYVPSSHWSKPPTTGMTLLVLPDVLTFWLVQQALGAQPSIDFTLLTRSHGNGVPPEWEGIGFWSRASSVTVASTIDDPPDLAEMIAAIAAVEVRVAALPDSGSWQSFLGDQGSASCPSIISTLKAARPVQTFGRPAPGLVRLTPQIHDIHELDGEGRMIRSFQVEERKNEHGDRHRSTSSYRDLVVRSDGEVLSPVVQRGGRAATPDTIHSLSDGSRILEPLSRAGRCRWSHESILRFARGTSDGAPDNGGRLGDVVQRIGQLIATSRIPLRPEDGSALACYLALSHVAPAFDRLPLLYIQGAASPGRTALAHLIAGAAHNGVVMGRAGIPLLHRIAHEMRGTIVLEDAGRLAVGGEVRELGRFVLSSLERAGAYQLVSSKDGIRNLRIFGPRVVVSALPPPQAIIASSLVLRTCEDGIAGSGDLAMVSRLRDDLYTWSMSEIGAVRSAASTEHFHSLGALICIAGLAFDYLLLARLEGLTDQAHGSAQQVEMESPDDTFDRALANCIGRSAGCFISLTQFQLELALLGVEAADASPERLGRWLASSPLVESGAGVARRRLYGQITRIYRLRNFVGVDGKTDDPTEGLDFCARRPCEACALDSVCVATIPGLKSEKLRRHGRPDSLQERPD